MELENWEAEFDAVLDRAFDEHGEDYEVYDPIKFGADIKDFIRRLLSSSAPTLSDRKSRQDARAAIHEIKDELIEILEEKLAKLKNDEPYAVVAIEAYERVINDLLGDN